MMMKAQRRRATARCGAKGCPRGVDRCCRRVMCPRIRSTRCVWACVCMCVCAPLSERSHFRELRVRPSRARAHTHTEIDSRANAHTRATPCAQMRELSVAHPSQTLSLTPKPLHHPEPQHETSKPFRALTSSHMLFFHRACRYYGTADWKMANS